MSPLLSATLSVVLLHLPWLLPRFSRLLIAGVVSLLALLVSPFALSSTLVVLLTAFAPLRELLTAALLTAALSVLSVALPVLTAVSALLLASSSSLAALLASLTATVSALLVPGRPALIRLLTLLVPTTVPAHLLGLLPLLAGLLTALLLATPALVTTATTLLVASAAVIDLLIGGIEWGPSASLRALAVPVLLIVLLAALPPLS